MALDRATRSNRQRDRQAGGDVLQAARSRVAAILLFVGTGSAVLSTTLEHYFARRRAATISTLVIALLLNVALILFGWRRHRDLSREVLEPRRRRGARPRAGRAAIR